MWKSSQQLFNAKPAVPIVSMTPDGRSSPTPHCASFWRVLMKPGVIFLFYFIFRSRASLAFTLKTAWGLSALGLLDSFCCAPETALRSPFMRRRQQVRLSWSLLNDALTEEATCQRAGNFGRLFLHLSALPHTWPMAHSRRSPMAHLNASILCGQMW